MKINLGDVHLLARRLRESAVAATIPAGLDPPLMASEMSVLDYLIHHLEGARVGDIARGTALAQSRVSTVVTRLKARGWIATRVPPEDARSTIVTVRPQVITGMKQVLQGDGISVIEQLLAGATQQKRSAALRGLAILIEHLRTLERHPAPEVKARTKGAS